MIFPNVASILQRVDSEQKLLYDKYANVCIDDIFRYHVHTRLKCILENVGSGGEVHLNYTDRCFVNFEHDIEGMWFIEDYAKRTS